MRAPLAAALAALLLIGCASLPKTTCVERNRPIIAECDRLAGECYATTGDLIEARAVFRWCVRERTEFCPGPELR